ncbi:MAG: tetratricopeptide repeat protein [Candidatus Tectomicrobia bacterium]|nr:tetratricopeptide repeat protein [Candidatus Tectomicrobia bacterium]
MWRAWLWRSALVLLLAGFTYAVTLSFAFTGDDGGVVTENTFIRSLAHLPELLSQGYFPRAGEVSYRPLVTLSYMFDWALWGDRPAGFHLTNVLLHALASATLVLVTAALFGDLGLALLTGAFFAVLPAASEAVAAVAFREDLLAALFSLLAMLCILAPPAARRGPAARPRWGGRGPAALVFLALALLAKEMALATPLVLALLVLRRQPPARRPPRRLAVALALELGLYLLVRFDWRQNPTPPPLPDAADGAVTMALNAVRIAVFYVLHSLVPVGASIDYSTSLHVGLRDPRALAALSLAALIGVGLWRAPGAGPLRLGLLWFFLALLPVSNLAPLHSPVAARYLYLPSSGWSLALAAAFTSAARGARARGVGRSRAPAGEGRRRRLAVRMLVGAALLCFVILTVWQTRVWESNYTLWRFGAAREPGRVRGHLNFAQELQKRRRTDAARHAWLTALSIDPRQRDPYNNIGNLQRQAGNLDKAVLLYLRWLRYEPRTAETLNNLGIALRQRGLVDRAILTYQQALRSVPEQAAASANLGIALLQRGASSAALRQFRRSLALDPKQEQAAALRAMVERLSRMPAAGRP